MATDEASYQDVPGRFHLKADYDTDFYAWTQTQADALRAKNWAVLDPEHLAEEIESLGKSDRRAIVSHLERLLLHLLKWGHDPAREPRPEPAQLSRRAPGRRLSARPRGRRYRH